MVLWRAHGESNPERSLRRALLYPFNYEHMKCKLLHLMKIILQRILYRNLYQLLILTSFTTTYCVQYDSEPLHVVFVDG